jgi:hypothetical protein
VSRQSAKLSVSKSAQSITHTAQRTQLTEISEVLVTSLTPSRLARRQAGAAPSGGALCRMRDPSACGRPAGKCPAARTAGGGTGSA